LLRGTSFDRSALRRRLCSLPLPLAASLPMHGGCAQAIPKKTNPEERS